MSADKTTKDMNIEEYFDDKYPDYHLRDCIESNDPLSLKELADEYADYKHSFLSNVSETLKLVDKFIESELPDAETPFHYEAEIASGMNRFKEWIESSSR